MTRRKKTAVFFSTIFLAINSFFTAQADGGAAEQARQSRYGINIGAKTLYASSAGWNASDGMWVYFGTYQGNPVRYRVLPDSPETQSAGGACILLDADTVLAQLPFHSSVYAGAGQASGYANEWSGSDLQSYLARRYEESLNGEKGAMFSQTEAGAIALTTTLDANKYNTGYASFVDYAADNYLFLLSAKEAKTLYPANADRIKTGAAGFWWVRSASAGNQAFAGFVSSNGEVYLANINAALIGLSPALNINASRILFTSDADKTCAPENGAVYESGGREWKLTLRDSQKTAGAADGACADLQEDGTVVVSYAYTDANSQNAANQISVMITDRDYMEDGARILYYGALQDIRRADGESSTARESASGTGTFRLPDGLPKGYRIYILAECVSGNQYSDYASEPSQIRFHQWSDWTTVKAATEKETGILQRTCEICGQAQERETAMLTGAAPATGDNSRIAVWIYGIVLSGLILMITAFKKIYFTQKEDF